MMHWSTQYIGTPWERFGNGPHAFDCYGLVRFVQQVHFSRGMPEIKVDPTKAITTRRAFKKNMEHDNWVQVDKPLEGDCVEMGEGKYVNHIGVWVEADGGGVLHCVQGAGTVFSKFNIVGAQWPLTVFWRAK